MINTKPFRVTLYLLICICTYFALDWASPHQAYMPKGTILMDPGVEMRQSIEPGDVRILPFLPASAEEAGWINIKKSIDGPGARQEVLEKARELAASVGANGIIVQGEGPSQQMLPGTNPFYIFFGRAIFVS